MEADKILLFSSDYPHWTFDDPRWVVKHIPESMRQSVMRDNGIAVYQNVPETVPGVEGQTIAY
jgi:predicted TIM-barrel fold metal-dependent hydrolase